MIKTIIFDIGNVLVPFDFKIGYARIESLSGYPAAEIPKRIRSTGLVTGFETGQIAPAKFVEELCAALDLNTNYSEFCELFNGIFLPGTLIPESFIEDLHRRYRLLLLSNTNPIHFQVVEANYPIIRHFDHRVLSHEAGCVKPSAEIYREALVHAECDATECLFVDDLPQNVEAARALGMEAIHFQGFEQLEEDLRSRGLI